MTCTHLQVWVEHVDAGPSKAEEGARGHGDELALGLQQVEEGQEGLAHEEGRVHVARQATLHLRGWRQASARLSDQPVGEGGRI